MSTALNRPISRLAVACIFICIAPAALAGAKFGADAPGARAHSLIKRFTGSWLIGYRFSDWEQVNLPTSLKVIEHRGMVERSTERRGA